MALYAARARNFEAEGGFKLVSREAFLLANNLLLVIAAGVVLVGTLAPLFVDVLGFGTISVGPPYFNLMFLVPVLPLVVLLGMGMHVGWRSMPGDALVRRLRWPALAAVMAGIAAPLIVFGTASVLTVVSVSIALWVCASSLLDPVRRLVFRTGAPLTRGQVGMYLAHFGVGVFMLGATVASAYKVELDVSARPGDTVTAGGYEFVFKEIRKLEGPNFVADEGEFELRDEGTLVAVLTPQIRTYQVQTEPMTEAAIDTNVVRDVFVALGEPLGDNRVELALAGEAADRFSVARIGCSWCSAGSSRSRIGGIAWPCGRRSKRRRNRRRERHSHVALSRTARDLSRDRRFFLCRA